MAVGGVGVAVFEGGDVGHGAHPCRQQESFPLPVQVEFISSIQPPSDKHSN